MLSTSNMVVYFYTRNIFVLVCQLTKIPHFPPFYLKIYNNLQEIINRFITHNLVIISSKLYEKPFLCCLIVFPCFCTSPQFSVKLSKHWLQNYHEKCEKIWDEGQSEKVRKLQGDFYVLAFHFFKYVKNNSFFFLK